MERHRFLFVDIFLPSAGASHGRSLLRPLVGAKIGGAPEESILRRISFTVCLSRWLHRQARLVAHLFCVLIFFLPSAGASHRRSLLRPLVGAKIGGAPGESFWRRISFARVVLVQCPS